MAVVCLKPVCHFLFPRMYIYIQGLYSKNIIYIITVIFLLFAGLQLFDKSGLTWRADIPAVKDIYLPFSIHIRYYEVTPGIISTIESIMGFVIALILINAIIRFAKLSKKKEAKPLLFCTGFVHPGFLK